MALSGESNTSLAFDTDVLKQCATEYGKIATDLRNMATELEACLGGLVASGWTTPAGTAFQKMVDSNWSKNIDKYADLLETLQQILNEAATSYEKLATNYIENTKI